MFPRFFRNGPPFSGDSFASFSPKSPMRFLFSRSACHLKNQGASLMATRPMSFCLGELVLRYETVLSFPTRQIPLKCNPRN
jgi:hypothetical protein